MSLNRLLVFAGFALLATPVVFGEAHCPGSASSVPLRLTQGTLFVVQVEVSGTGPYDFLVDTGAQINSIDEALAAGLHLTPDREVGVSGAGTYSRASLVKAGLRVGSEAVHDSQSVLVHSAQLQTIDPHLQGILGGSFLEHFDFLIDNRNRTLCLDRSGDLAAAIKGKQLALIDPTSNQSPYPPFTRPLIVAARLSNYRQSMLLVLDSGTNSPFLFSDRPHVPLLISGSRQILRRFVDGHEQDFSVMPPQEVRIDNIVVHAVSFVIPMNSIGRSGIAPESDGALPTIAFRRIFISCSKAYVILDPWN